MHTAPVVVIGAGPAGLTAACELVRSLRPVAVLEQDLQIGGLARTVEYRGFRFDVGGHRFFTKIPLVADLWHSLLGESLLVRPRLSRIYYRGRFFDYPLKPLNTLRNLGMLNTLLMLASYLRSCMFPVQPEKSFEDWVTNRFGSRLYTMFFKTYTEKVWGIPSSSISAQWAAQRIQGLSLRTALLNMLVRARGGKEIKTLVHRFLYPRLGPGMMWDAMRERIVAGGGSVEIGCTVRGVLHSGDLVQAVQVVKANVVTQMPVSHVISTMPLKNLVEALSPAAPPDVVRAAQRLRYRDFLTVVLIIDNPSIFPDNWIYVHDETVKVGRIQNFGNWSPALVPEEGKSCLGLEYFCFEGDDLWNKADRELVALATQELQTIGLLVSGTVVDGVVIRMRKAYPVYDEAYQESLPVIRAYLNRFRNLQTIGRNGMHRYNNMDHSMYTAMLAVRNIMGEQHDLWKINDSNEYIEDEEQ